MYHEFPPIAFIAALSLLVPLSWHWRAGNISILAIIFWLFITNIIYGVDAIVWGDNTEIVIPVWCDITTKIIVGANFALPAACFCVAVHLERVASLRQLHLSETRRRRRNIFEALMCFGLPIIFMALHYIVQGHRFDIIESFGCRPSAYISIPALFIIYIPPIVIAIATLIVAALSLRHFIIRSTSVVDHFKASNPGLTASRYLRFMLMAITQTFWSLTLTCFTLWSTVYGSDLRPWTTWADVHYNFSRVDRIELVLLPPEIVQRTYIMWWTIPSTTLLFVAFFAFGQEAMEEYRYCIKIIRDAVFRRNGTYGKQNNSINFAPTSCPQQAHHRQVSSLSIPSLADAISTSAHTTSRSPSSYKDRIVDSTDSPSLEVLPLDLEAPFSFRVKFKPSGSLTDTSSVSSITSDYTPSSLPGITSLELSPAPSSPASYHAATLSAATTASPE